MEIPGQFDVEINNLFLSQLIAAGRVPLVTQATIEMHSEALEHLDDLGQSIAISTPGKGNEGLPVDPGFPEKQTKPPPQCLGMGCSVTELPGDPGSTGGGGGGGDTGGGNLCSGGNCPVCKG